MTPPTAAPAWPCRHSREWLWGLGMVAIALCAYWPSLGADLIWDDVLFVGKDRTLNMLGGLREIWAATKIPDFFPLTFSSLWLEEKLFGFSAFPHHLVNVLLHAASGLLLVRVLRKLDVTGAWFVAAVFVVHPVNVASVAWISERKNTLSLVFYLASADFYLALLASETRRRLYALSLFAFVLALLSKTSTVVLPVALLIFTWWRRRRLVKRDFTQVAPFFGLAVASGLLGMHFQWTRAMAFVPSRSDGLLSRIAVAGEAVWFYLSKVGLPINLNILYPKWSTWSGQVPAVRLLPAAGVVLLLWLLWRHRWAWTRAPLAGFVFFLSHIFPVLGFFQMSYMNNSLVADHWQYLPMLGIIAVTGGGAAWIAQQRAPGLVASGAACLLIAALGVLTFRRAALFHDNETVWRDAAVRNPESIVVHKNFASGLRDKGMTADAIREFRKVLAMHGKARHGHARDSDATKALVQLLKAQGRHEDAINVYRDAVRGQVDAPELAPDYNDLGVALGARPESLDEAIRYLRTSIRLKPDVPFPHVNLGVLLYRKGDLVAAVASIRQGMHLGTSDSNAPIEMARILSSVKFAQRDLGEALRMAERAVQMTSSGSAEAFAALAVVYAEAGRCAEAGDAAGKALAMKPGEDRQDVIDDMKTRVATCKAGAAAFAAAKSAADQRGEAVPSLQGFVPGYTTSSNCQSCHASQYGHWHASYHRTMTQVPTPATVVGDFYGKRMEFEGSVFRTFRQGGDYWVEFGPWKKQVALLTGSHHQQAYWYETGKGKQLAMFPLVYLIAERRWVPDYAIFLKPPSRFLKEEEGLWNHNCLLCHTTQGRPGEMGQRVDTEVAELGIACESCHGPGQEHAAGKGKVGAIIDPRRIAAQQSSAVCGSCHAVQVPRPGSGAGDWNQFGRGLGFAEGGTPPLQIVRPRQDVRAGYLAALQKDDPEFLAKYFWPDGMIRVTGREYNGLVESPCYAGGKFSCLSCHDMHRRKDDRRPLAAWTDDQLAPGMGGDGACLQCHAKYEKAAALTEHTHHETKSPGSRCMNCHMPNTTYGLLKATRSHQISSPVVAGGAGGERPNACNLCHLDKPVRWAANMLESWYKVRPPARLSPGDESVAAGTLWALQGDAGMRALAAWSMGWQPARQASGSDWMVPPLAHLLEDPYPAVRFIAGRSLRTRKELGRFDYDFVGPAQARAVSSAAVLAGWQAHARVRQGKPEVLVQPDGTRDDARFSALARRRDDRPVNLRE